MVEPNARSIATEVLYRVAKGAYAAPLLDAAIRRSKLRPEQSALATEITYGSLRVLTRLDALIDRYARRARAIDEFAQAALRTAIFQLLYLEHSAAHAVVNDAVKLVRVKRGPQVAGFANALLRKILQHESSSCAMPGIELPQWFHHALLESLGERRTRAFIERPLPPPLGLRINPERTDREVLTRKIAHARARAEVKFGQVSPLGLLVRHSQNPRTLPGYEEGWFCVQEEGAQAMALALDAQPTERIADTCAGHGNKTTLLAQQVGPRGHVAALDRYASKLERLPPEFQRLGLPLTMLATLAVDLTVGCAGLEGTFDRVLIDLPCTGLGTVHRRPELLLRYGQDDPQRLHDLQSTIATQALRLARPGGHVILGVCSLTREEGATLVNTLEQRHPTLSRAWTSDALPPGASIDDDGLVRLGPWLADDGDGPDGYQMMRWQVG
ncbi:MAG: hypothetical protein H6714_02780 [Myxococcales bacterium]|nr:hypothetical protein [Myxococcales bacterium]